MGEVIDLEKSQSSDSFSVKSGFFSQAAKPHGSHQESSETSNSTVVQNQPFSSRTDYDKLCLSLLCGLPNEQELALNVCTILSNEGNYMLHLEQAPKLVDLLIAQTGIFPAGDDALKLLYLESWKDLKGRNMHRFWRSTLDTENEELMELLALDLGDYDPHCKLLNLESELGAHNVEGQRVLRIALILHNLSFEKYNVPVLITSRNFMRFVLLCVHSSWGNLKQVSYDTLSNLSSAIKLSVEKDVCSRLIFRTVVDGILSYDRYMNIRSMDILAQLCSYGSNEDVIPSRLDVEVYQQMVSFLTVRDIMLLFYTLEALYALSDLGRYACDKIVSVHRCIGALVSLLTLDPSDYGPAGQINMKVVKTLVPADSDVDNDCTGTVIEDAPLSPAPTPVPAITAVNASIVESVDSDVFANNWLKSSYETSPGNSISRNELYSDYLACCTKAGRKDVVNANVFADCVRKTFPMCGVKKLENRGVITFHHDGLQKKGYAKALIPVSKSAVNTIVTKVSTMSTATSCKPPQKTTFNSILKSQLSAAPKILPASPLKNATQVLPNQKIQISPQTSLPPRTSVPTTQANTGSSTLIKSLLASKVQQRNLQQQVIPSNVSKMVIYSPGGSGLQLGPHTTVVRCIRPGGGTLHAVNIGSPLRSPLQTCLVSNNTRIITNASPRFVKNTTVIRHALQPQVIKQGIVTTNPTPRINGLQKDIQIMEDETIKPTAIVATSSQLSQLNLDQSQVVQRILDNSQHSTFANGDNSRLVKSVNLNELNLNASTVIQNINSPSVIQSVNSSSVIQNVNSTSVIQNTELLKLIGANSLSQSDSPMVVNSKSSIQVSNEDLSVKDNRESNISNESKKDTLTFEQPVIATQQKSLSSPTSILKSVLSDLDTQSDEIKKQQQLQQQKDILKRAPLLNGLLDKGKLPSQTIQTNTILLNGNEHSTMEIVGSKENKPSQFVQLNQNQLIIPVSSLNTVIQGPQSNLIFMPVSSMNHVISSVNPVISSSPLTTGILATSSVNSTGTFISTSNSAGPFISTSNSAGPFISTSNSTVQLSVPNPVMPSSTFLSNGSNVMQLCIGQTPLTGTVEVQSDQQGVVRLHIESPENSNQGSDLSSISDITRTLECASKALLKTNAECNTQVSFGDTCDITTPASTPITTIVTTTSPSTLTRTAQQQFFVVTPTINQPQLQIQQPNFKFHILHSIPKIEESVDLISFQNPTISQSSQLQQQPSETPILSTTSLKRPSSDSSIQLSAPISKKLCMDSAKSLISESLQTPTSVPCTLVSSSDTVKPIQDAKSILSKTLLAENSETVSKLITPVLASTPKAVVRQVPKIEAASEKVTRTFSGLSAMSNIQPVSTPSQVPQKSATQLEFLCEWKNCGLKFKTPSSVFLHATKAHAPLNSNDLVCLWEGCESIKRRRLSHLTHLQDWHCNDGILHNQAVRRRQIAQTGKSSIPLPQKPPPHPGYAPDAALLAIKRHALQYINPKELSEEKESVLTKSIRLTSALILRNLVTHSNLAKTYVRRFEPDIAYLAMSPVESARTLSQCLSQLYTTHD